MTYAIDHVLVCCSEGAETEAARLAAIGLVEGAPNTHPGQGTACRRFFLHSAYIELLWVADAGEAQGEVAAPTRLWERWSRRQGGACPFGLVVRPAGGVEREPPFASWAYHPPYLPAHLAIDVADGTPLDEPAMFYLRFARPPAEHAEARALEHRLPISGIAAVEIALPGAAARSAPARALEDAGLVSFRPAGAFTMTLTLQSSGPAGSVDLRPELPLVLNWRV